MRNIQAKARDNARTPMQVRRFWCRLGCIDLISLNSQWDSSKNAGFTAGTPWMRVHDDYEEWNVESQRNKPTSILNFYATLFQLRKDHLALVSRSFLPTAVPRADTPSRSRSTAISSRSKLRTRRYSPISRSSPTLLDCSSFSTLLRRLFRTISRKSTGSAMQN